MNLNTKLTCPACGSERPMTAFQVQEEFHEIFRLAARFGKSWPWIEEYLHCFRSAPDKPLRATRVKIILEEILGFLNDGGFPYDGKVHVVRSDAIHAAIKCTALTGKCGFKNHHYLMKVAIDFNKKMIESEENAQRQREEQASKRIYSQNGLNQIKKIISGLPKNDLDK